ncbi:MAG: N-6 DNA methylase [Nitrospirae bacterium]|nr:N-6 DNA methylase [Nitrospirota bacterium]
MGRSTVHYADNKTNNILKALHNKLRPAGTPVQRVEYIIELLLLRIFEVKLKRDDEFKELRKLFNSDHGNENKLFYHLQTIGSENILSALNKEFFPFYSNILQEARKVLKENLSIKVQDQLTLIHEVFANSNFTNNVQSGNLEDIIALISDIDEDRLLNTDLLGDAIESALSETGGTKDIGLFRTPDHVRQFMVGMLEPAIKDTIFDPACGTGGFLFDSFEYVMERIEAPYRSKDEPARFPGAKSHPELQGWFRKYFSENSIDMPSIEETAQFYRSGISGIEYLGMIRKMAAVNFYVRGLNPANLEQGDSLAKFNAELAGSKSLVLANPPFGAERDQKAYPNVWEDYSKESETTILFVKMMFDSLREGGKCAVVVSEGFLTWEQGSAKSLRKMLLEDANLQAVIGLPQGVFISKTGQGPKTSILIFEKGKPTEKVWFYNVENDGFTKGANRTPVEGCQLTEALDLYHQYVKLGKTPPETRRSFSLSVEWLMVVDPRIKERIRKETREAFDIKREEAREKLIDKLNTKLENAKKAKTDKFNKKAYDSEIWKFDTTWENKILNEIAQRIDKAHTYSFNPTHYRSSLSESQLNEWDKVVEHHKPPSNGHSLDKRFEMLLGCALKDAINCVANFDPLNAIEADIVREYLSNIEAGELQKHPALAKIDEILKSGARYPRVKLVSYIKEISERNNKDRKLPVMLVSKNYGMMLSDDYFSNRKLNKVYSNDLRSYKVIRKNQFAYSGIHANEGAIGYLKDYDEALVSGIYKVFSIDEKKILPAYLEMILRSDTAIKYYNKDTQGTIERRTNLSFDHFKNLDIPLPDINTQKAIISAIHEQLHALDKIAQMKTDAENKISQIINAAWEN